MRLKNKNAIVTGAASGIGRAIAIGYAREGARVIAADINLSGAQSTVETIRAAGSEALAVEVDVTQQIQVAAMLAAAVDAFEQIHILVAVPGISTTRNFLDLPEDEWDQVLNVNLKGVYLCGQAVSQHMAQNGEGVIVNVSSICDEVAMADSAHYMASKGGVKMLAKAMALDLVDHNIRVNALAPGFVLSPFTAVHLETEAGREHRRKLLARNPMGRAAQPEEMVGAAIFLASDESSYVTGISLAVDGGYSAV